MSVTATRLFAVDPEKYNRAVALMQDGATPDSQISRVLGLRLHTVHSIRERERERLNQETIPCARTK